MASKQRDLQLTDPMARLLEVRYVVAIDPGNNSGVGAAEVGGGFLGQAKVTNIEKKTAKGKAGPPQRIGFVQAALCGEEGKAMEYLALIEDAALSSFPSQSAAAGFVTSRTRWFDALRSDPVCIGVANYHVISWRKSADLWTLRQALGRGTPWKEVAQVWLRRRAGVEAVSHDAAEAAVMALQAAAMLHKGFMTVEVAANGECTVKLGGKPITYMGTS